MLLFLLYVITFLFGAQICTSDDLVAFKTSSIIEYGLERLTAIESNSNNCFKRVSVELYKECPTANFHSVKNMKYAVLLSMCEFKMVGASLPKECDEKLLTETRNIKACAKKLSGGSQTWTTYNGYFKDIGMICFSIRYPIEKEVISLLYGNISAVQLETSNILKEQQKYLIEWRHEEMAHLKNIISMQQKVSNQTVNIKKIMNQTATQLGDYFDILLVLQKQAETGLEKQNKKIQVYVDEARIQLDKLAYEKDVAIDSIFALLSQEVKTINDKMSEMDNLQSDNLKQWIEIKDVQEQYLTKWQQSLSIVDSCIQSVLSYTIQEVKNTEKNLSMIHSQLEDTFFWVEWLKNIGHKFYQIIKFLLLHSLFWYRVCLLFRYLEIKLRYLILTFFLTTLLVPYNIKVSMNNYTPFISVCIVIYELVTRRTSERFHNNDDDDDDNDDNSDDGSSFRPSSSSRSSVLSFFSVPNSDLQTVSDHDSDGDVPGIPNEDQVVQPQIIQVIPYHEQKMTVMRPPPKEFTKCYFHRYYRRDAFKQEAPQLVKP